MSKHRANKTLVTQETPLVKKEPPIIGRLVICKNKVHRFFKKEDSFFSMRFLLFN